MSLPLKKIPPLPRLPFKPIRGTKTEQKDRETLGTLDGLILKEIQTKSIEYNQMIQQGIEIPGINRNV